PQGNNNLISGYIGFLYLFFGDLEIESILKDLNLEYESILEEFKIVRYVDDIYLFLKFKGLKIIDKGVNRDSDNLIVQMNKLGRTLDEILYDYKSRENAKKFISDFLFKLSDTFYKKLNLKFNSKSEIFWLDSDKDKNKLLKVINKVSEDYIEIEDDNKVKPQEKILRICKSLRNIKSKSIIEMFTSDYKNIQHILRYSFDKNVNQLLDNKRNELKKIEDEFQNFDFNYVRFYPQTIILLINKIDDVKKLFRKFLLSKKNLTTFDIDLVIHFLCQTGFKDNKLIDILANSEISEIINRYKKSLNVVDNTKTGYYNISFSKLLPLINKEISLIEQIKFRVFAEKRNEFSVALNHLLNEVQLICYLVENPAIEIKKYDISNVKSYLESKEIETNLCNNISNLFDRRNNNPVSHPGNDTRFAKTVLKDEYFEYKTEVGKVLKKIF
ncbi:MAG: hypothetical protein MUE85_18130, partial [Microscillaceae bacterium]|nr:hypothetical protein [Microscillaceae bacterium]